MRTCTAALAVASLIFAVAVAVAVTVTVAGAAQAAPTQVQVQVRIEGQSETLFEGPIWTAGHDVQASSDSEPRSCDGTNNHKHPTPGATPTAAAVDAMHTIGESFDAQWYGSAFDDYFLTRFGPDEQSLTEGAYWGILVNNVFTSVGGCQYELGPDNEVLWVYDAFDSRPFLALLPAGAGYSSGLRPLTATAELGKPFEVEVVDYADDTEDNPPLVPERRGSTPEPGARVAPVLTATNGFEKVESEASSTVVTDAQGKASVTFDTPGWHRIKATVVTSQGREVAVRSNRLDVCVPAAGESGCGEPLAEDLVRTPPAPEAEVEGQGEGEVLRPLLPVQRSAPISTPPSGSGTEVRPTVPGPPAGLATVQLPTLDGRGAARGLVGVSWRISEPGVGLSSWAIASRASGVKAARYVTRARGKGATSALVKLPPGITYDLQITFTDILGRTSTAQIGKVTVPHDDRWSGLHHRGAWQRTTYPGAWLGTVSRGSARSQVSARLPAGRPLFLLRSAAVGAKAEVRVGSEREVFAITPGSTGAARLIVATRRSRAGMVRLRVLKGTVNLDGVAVEP